MSIVRMLVPVAVLLCPLLVNVAPAQESAQGQTFRPGELWPDDNGVHINAHGGGILLHDGVYYWFGEHKSAGRRAAADAGVHCYSSTDLYNWSDRGIVLSVSDDPESDIVRGCIIERPKVIYNTATKKFVMWFHLELRGQGYNAARTGVAVSESVTGPYTFLRSLRPNAGVWPDGFEERGLAAEPEQEEQNNARSIRRGVYTRRDFEGGQMSRDMTLFVDDDGKAYHVHAAEENYTLNISELTDDYLDFTGRYVRVLPGGHNEAPALFKTGGKYYLLMSGATGWAPNAARSAVADSIWGPWQSLGNPCVGINEANGMGPELTFGGQSTCVLPAPGKQDALIAMFDVWRPNNHVDGRYLWLPLRMTANGFRVVWRNEWALAQLDEPLPVVEKVLAAETGRQYVDFDFDWRFQLGDTPIGFDREVDDSNWRPVQLPHDWSIEGPFGPQYASGTGYAPGGIAWYRKRFTLGQEAEGKHVAVEFDGVYQNSQVWINGQLVGRRPFGYASFQYDLTPYLDFEGENVLAVRVDHTKFADSRWYTGSGIYRHVRLRLTEPLAVAHWGTFVTTPAVSGERATVAVETNVQNRHDSAQKFALRLTVLGPDGKEVAAITADVAVEAKAVAPFRAELAVENPSLWSLDDPALYRLRTELLVDSQVVDATDTTFGIRTFRFDPNEGFFLNGKNLKIKGVCLHHDAGCLGAAVPDKVLERRLRLMKELGVNAIRVSHNPPAPELLDMCDRLGLLAQDEAFDEFTPPKNKWVDGRNVGRPARFGYGEFFEQWAERDIQDMVRRDRNHPSIIMWSIGNEIDFPNDPFTHPVLGNEYRPTHPPAEQLIAHGERLVRAVKQLDTTRPVTAALAALQVTNEVGFPELLDVVGYNYQEGRYVEDHERFPHRVIYGSENGDAYNAWLAVAENDFISGQFLWTGIDYLGEAGRWPSRVFAGGLLDLATFKKPDAWWRQALWSDQPVVYLAAGERRGGGRGRGRFGGGGRGRGRGRGGPPQEQWNWPAEAQVRVQCATNCPEVDLYLNGELVQTLTAEDDRQGWRIAEIAYQPGQLEAVGRDGDKELARFALHTAGAPHKVHVESDVAELAADGRDVAHLIFTVVDANGHRVPEAEHEVEFTIDGPVRLLGIDNGRTGGAVDYQDNVAAAYRGRGLAIVQAERQPGQAKVTVSAEGLESTEITLNVR